MPSPSRNPDRHPLTRTSHQHLSTSRTLPCTIPTIRHQIQNNLRPPSPSVSSHLLPATEICNSPHIPRLPSCVHKTASGIIHLCPPPASPPSVPSLTTYPQPTTRWQLLRNSEQRAVNRGGWGGIAPRMKRVLAIPIPPPPSPSFANCNTLFLLLVLRLLALVICGPSTQKPGSFSAIRPTACVRLDNSSGIRLASAAGRKSPTLARSILVHSSALLENWTDGC